MKERESKKRKYNYEYININKNINNIDDLLNLIDIYYSNKKARFNINLKLLSKLYYPLKDLNNVIGMSNVKKNIVNHIIYYLQDLDNDENMMHTVIKGPPGVGKTMLAKIIGDIYIKLGVINTSFQEHRFEEYRDRYNFKIARRSDLIGRYLGETAIKTQEFIDSCYGGIMFIDEAYSLGNEEGRDSFSKECIDTINQNLTENKGNFLCIIAGYKDSLDKCFFSYNEGLKRRFPFVYEIEKYTPNDLKNIFKKMIKDMKWEIKDIEDNFFENYYEYFTNFAGDIETFIFKCKIEHSKRVFCLSKEEKKKLSKEDINKGFEEFKKNKKIKIENNINKNMYI